MGSSTEVLAVVTQLPSLYHRVKRCAVAGGGRGWRGGGTKTENYKAIPSEGVG